MTDTITLVGTVGTTPSANVTTTGLHVTSLRLASPNRHWDKNKAAFVDGEPNWYTVKAFRALAVNVARSIKVGDRIVVTGRLKLRPWKTDTGSGLSVEVEVESIGHDLMWGTTTFTKVAQQRDASATAAVPSPVLPHDAPPQQGPGETESSVTSNEFVDTPF